MPEDAAVFEAGLSHGWRVNDRHELLEIVEQQPVKERLVTLLQRHEEDVFLEIRRLPAHLCQRPHELRVQLENARRHEPAQPERILLLPRKARALREQGIVDQGQPGGQVVQAEGRQRERIEAHDKIEIAPAYRRVSSRRSRNLGFLVPRQKSASMRSLISIPEEARLKTLPALF